METTQSKAKSSDVGASAGGEKRADAPQAGDERINSIATIAYYKAEARGFVPGHEVEDWLAAEAELGGSETRR